MASQRSLLRSGSALSLLTLVSRVLGLVREMTRAALLGTGALSDAFSIAFLLPNLFRRLFAEGSIAVAFIPTFKEYLVSDNHTATRDFLRAFWTFLSLIVSIAVALGILFAPQLVSLIRSEVTSETVLLTRIMFPYLFFISIAAFFQGMLNSVHRFVPSALAPILLNIVVIYCAWLLSPFTANPARAMALGVLLGGFLEAAIQLPFVLKNKFSFPYTSIKRAFLNPGTRKVLRLVGPTIIGMAAYQLNDVVSTMLADRAGVGIVSSLQFSLRLQELMLGIFAVTIGTVLLPQFAEEAKTQNWTAYNQRLRDAVAVIALITIPVIFFSLTQGEYLIRLLFQTRRFDEHSVALTLEAFRFHIAGLFFIALNRILAPAFYAQSDSVSPTIAGVISFAANIVLAFVLVGGMAGGGIALALSLAGAVNTFFLFLFMRRNKAIALRSILVSSLLYVLKITFCSIIAAMPLVFFSPRVYEFFARGAFRHKLIIYAAPFALNALFFALAGIVLLALMKDRCLRTLLRRKNTA